MFSVKQREGVRAFVLDLAATDSRVTAGAVVGSFARGTEDRWSDIDLTFAVADDVSATDVIADWTTLIQGRFRSVPLWSGEVGGRTYQVFLLPGRLQVDLSFSPAAQFRPAAPAFRLLFGDAGPPDPRPLPDPDHFVGWGVLQALHAWRCVERRRYWQSEQAIGAVRDCALSIACIQQGLDPTYGRGFDDLPPETLARAEGTHVASLEPPRLKAALGSAVGLLLLQIPDVRTLPREIEADLRALSS